MSQQPPQLPAPVPAVATVSITPGGDIDASMSIGEVVESLGLVGNGIGGRVGVRDPKVLLGFGLCFTVSDITIVELNPPGAKKSVSGLGPNGYEPTFKKISCGVEDLVAVASKETVVEKNMLKISSAPQMVRLPKCPIEDCIAKWMRAAAESLLEECSLSQANILNDLVEVIDVSNGMQKGQSLPMVQCRAIFDKVRDVATLPARRRIGA